MALGYGRTGTNQFACAKFIVDTNGISAGATHSTIASAISSASSGDTIFIKPGTYTENLTLVAGVNINSDGDSTIANNVIIVGKMTASFNGLCMVKNVIIRNGTSQAVELTTSSTSVHFFNCYFDIVDTTATEAILVSAGSISFFKTRLKTSFTSIKPITFSGTSFSFSDNEWRSTDLSTFSSGTITFRHSTITSPVQTSGTANIKYTNCQLNTAGSTALLAAGGTAEIYNCYVTTTTATSLTATTILTVAQTDIDCTHATTAIDGAGTINYGGLTFSGTQEFVTTTTQNLLQHSHFPQIDIVHTATENDDHAVEIDCSTGNFADVKALDINYSAGIVQAGDDEECILINIDETVSTGGQIIGMQVLTTTEGSAQVVAVKMGPGIDAIRQEVGTFGNADTALNKAVDVQAALASGGAGNISLFVSDDDTFTVGDAASFGALEVIISTGASGNGISPTFEYSTGISMWQSFSPADGTNSFRNTGVIEWDVTDLAGFTTGAGTKYLIRITRTRNNLGTTPIVDEVQIAALTEYKWDKNGAITAASLALTTDLAVTEGGTGRSSHTAYAVICGGTTTTAAQQSIASVGTAAQVLTSNGAGALPTFQAPAASGSFTTIGDVSSGAVAFDGTVGTALTSTTAGLTLTCANNSGGVGGPITLNGGASTNATSAGGTAKIEGGAGSTTGAGGITTVKGGAGGNAGAGGIFTIQGGAGAGTNIAASDSKIAGCIGTGTGATGHITVDCDAQGGTTGTTIHGQVPRFVFNGFKTLSDNVAATLITLITPTNGWSSGHLFYTIECTDGTDYQAVSGIVAYASTGKAGAYTGTTSVLGTEAKNLTSGTLAVTWAVTSGYIIQVTANSSLTPTILRITYNVSNGAQQTFTLS